MHPKRAGELNLEMVEVVVNGADSKQRLRTQRWHQGEHGQMEGLLIEVDFQDLAQDTPKSPIKDL